MLPKERQNIIYSILKKESAVTTAELIEHFGISDETIRRDLLVLEKEGKLQRVHGGAVSVGEMKPFLTLSRRIQDSQPEKAALSDLAMSFITENDTIAIDCGSTAVEFAKVLAGRFEKLTVVTHSLDVFSILTKETHFSVILCGGQFHHTECAFWGPMTLAVLDNIRVNKAFIFPSAVSLSNGICDFDPELFAVQKKLIEISNDVFILANSSKYENTALLKVSDTNPNYTYITDPAISPKLKKLYRENGINIISSEEDIK